MREASASEPLQKCRKRIRRCQNRGLKDDSRTDAEVLQAAVLSLVYQALGESEIGRERLRYV